MTSESIDKRLLTGDLKSDERNVRLLLESIGPLFSAESIDDLLGLGLTQATGLAGADRGRILLENTAGEMEVRAAHASDGHDAPLDTIGLDLYEQRVMRTGESIVGVDAEDTSKPDTPAGVCALKLLSLMATPLFFKGRTRGVLSVLTEISGKSFNQSDLAILDALGGILAVALEIRTGPGQGPATS